LVLFWFIYFFNHGTKHLKQTYRNKDDSWEIRINNSRDFRLTKTNNVHDSRSGLYIRIPYNIGTTVFNINNTLYNRSDYTFIECLWLYTYDRCPTNFLKHYHNIIIFSYSMTFGALPNQMRHFRSHSGNFISFVTFILFVLHSYTVTVVTY